MKELIVLANIIGLLAALAAAINLFYYPGGPLRRQLRWLLMVMVFSAFAFELSNLLEWSGITSMFDPYEDVLEVMEPLIWTFLFYAIIQSLARQDLGQSEERFRTLVEQAVDPFFLCDVKGRLKNVNQMACESLGFSRDELLQMSAGDFVIEGNPEESIQKVLLSKTLHTFDAVHQRKDGSTFPVEVRIGPLKEGPNTYFLALARDVSERREAERERGNLESKMRQTQRLESLGVLAGGIAHDFNNLLTGIVGNISIALSDSSLSCSIRDRLLQVEKAGKKAALLTKELLAFSGRGTSVTEPVNVTSIVEEMADILKVSISKRATLCFRLSGDLPFVEGDSTQIAQVAMNLITNASDALEGEAGVISITTGEIECSETDLANTHFSDGLLPGSYVYFEVSDTGCGMDSSTLAKIFDPFFTTKIAGRGLGLAAVIGIVQSHRGTFRIESEVQKGTSFRVLFPQITEVVKLPKTEKASTKPWSGSGVALVVDDEEIVRELAEDMLSRAGFEVLLASDGKAGIEILKERMDEIRFVLLDMTMPGLSGEETFRSMLELKNDVKVILSSGYNEEEAISGFLEEGLEGFLQKPYTDEELLEKVGKALGE